jgi:hypothetical protein
MALLIHYQAGSTTSSQPANLVSRKAYLESSPFDGVTCTIPISFNFQTPGNVLSYATAFNALSPMQGQFTRLVHNYVRLNCQLYADPFDDWTQAQANWVNIAKAMRDVGGFDGIYYDNEEYSGLFWAYPGSQYKHTSTQNQSQYAEQWRLRGNQIMAAMRAVHPTVRVIHAHTPAWSQSGAPGLVWGSRGGPLNGNGSDLRGYFAAGMLAAAAGSMIDGGEDYAFRTSSDFQASWNWLHNTWPSITPNTVVPASLASTWGSAYDVSFGIYDQTFGSTVTMTPSVMQSCVTNALNRADSLIWTYSEGNDYLTPNSSTTATNFVNAIAAGKAAATPSTPAAPKNLRITAHS